MLGVSGFSLPAPRHVRQETVAKVWLQPALGLAPDSEGSFKGVYKGSLKGSYKGSIESIGFRV